MARLEWQEKGIVVGSKWYLLVDHENQKDWWSVKYRSFGKGRSKLWQMMYPNSSFNHALLQSEVSEEQLRRNLEMEYLLLRGDDG
jgi:hypothetical protein